MSEPTISRYRVNVERLLNMGTALLVILAIVIAFPILKRKAFPVAVGEYAVIPELIGRALDSLTIVSESRPAVITLKGSASILYVFATTCKFCDSQKEHVAELLATVPAHIRVYTGSGEIAAVTASYWHLVDSSLARPLSLRQPSVTALDAKTVPRLYFIGRNGTIKAALTGTVLTWTADSLRHALRTIDAVPEGS